MYIMSRQAIDEHGNVYGRLTVLSRAVQSGVLAAWRCSCSCTQDRLVVVKGADLRRGAIKSCGCLRRTVAGQGRTPEYRAWYAMMRRCYHKEHEAYDRYGGRGIQVDARWHVFDVFLNDIGKRPSPKHSLERKENNEWYKPGNVVWATSTEQNQNRRNNRLITYKGRTMCLSAWEQTLSLPRGSLKRRLATGWSDVKALTTPLLSYRDAGRLSHAGSTGRR